MRVSLTNPITGHTRFSSAHLTLNHSASSYGQPVMVVAGAVLGPESAILQGAKIVVAPKRSDQVRLLRQWQELACLMLDLRKEVKNV